MTKGRRQRVDDAEISQRDERAGSNECDWIYRLYAHGQVTHGDNHRLHHHHHGHEQETAQISLAHREPLKAFQIHLHAEDDHEHEGTDPQREVRKQRGHRGTVGAHRIDWRALHLNGISEEGTNLIGVQAGDGLQFLGPRVSGDGADVVTRALHTIFQGGKI